MPKVITTLLKTLFMAVAVAFVAVILEGIIHMLNTGWSWTAENQSQWSSVPGTVSSYGGEDSEGYVSVKFKYAVAGISYRGRQSWHGEERKYSPGEALTVYYNPAKPNIAVVDPTKPSMAQETSVAFLFGVGLFSAIFLALVAWTWASPRIWRVAGVGLGLVLVLLQIPRVANDPTFWILVGVYLMGAAVWTGRFYHRKVLK
ncbi:MAG: DUF3592 domain-containing protein [Chloroflexi bacterium]|nr:DUF3592 domain-containing protein [Chloroflexota bacterium]